LRKLAATGTKDDMEVLENECILVDRPTLGFERILNKLRILEYLLC